LYFPLPAELRLAALRYPYPISMKLYHLPIPSKLVQKLLVMFSVIFISGKTWMESTAGVLVNIRGPVNTHHTFPCLAINFSQTASGSCFIRVASESDSFIQNPKRYFLIFQPRKRGIPHGNHGTCVSLTWCCCQCWIFTPFLQSFVNQPQAEKRTEFLIFGRYESWKRTAVV
jgi:hypothetical protein